MLVAVMVLLAAVMAVFGSRLALALACALL